MSLLEPPPFASWADLEREALACTKCPLAETRTQVVFGVGDPHTDLLFVGEGPGEQEDIQGEPFVGRAGKLLDRLGLAAFFGSKTACQIHSSHRSGGSQSHQGRADADHGWARPFRLALHSRMNHNLLLGYELLQGRRHVERHRGAHRPHVRSPLRGSSLRGGGRRRRTRR